MVGQTPHLCPHQNNDYGQYGDNNGKGHGVQPLHGRYQGGLK